MTNVMEQALFVSKKYKGKENEFHKYNNKILIRIPTITNETIEWKDEYVDLNVDEMNYIGEVDAYINEIQIKKVLKKKYPHNGEIEFDAFYHIQTVKDEKSERPYFPLIGTFISCEKETVLEAKMVKPDISYCISLYRDCLIDIIKKQKNIPQIIYVENKLSAQIMEPIANKLDIKLIMVEILPFMSDMKDELFDY